MPCVFSFFTLLQPYNSLPSPPQLISSASISSAFSPASIWTFLQEPFARDIRANHWAGCRAFPPRCSAACLMPDISLPAAPPGTSSTRLSCLPALPPATTPGVPVQRSGTTNAHLLHRSLPHFQPYLSPDTYLAYGCKTTGLAARHFGA